MTNTFIIAEVGTAHDGLLELAKRHIDAAAETGADAVKFQCYRDAGFLRKDEPPELAAFFLERRFTESGWRQIAAHCYSKGIEFMASAFDRWAVDLLTDIGVQRHKVASRTLRDDPKLVTYIIEQGKPVYISLGMVKPGRVIIMTDSALPVDRLTFFHCVSQYPTPPNEAALGEIKKIKETCDVGYSDHTVGITAPIAAVALGATLIEKHFRLEPGNPDHPDYSCSLNPAEFTEMVQRIREVEVML